MPELINDPALATEFFRSLRDVFGRADPQLTRILYGTDWIMMGHERNNSRYLEAVVAAMGRAGYSEEQKHNILYANARRFLAG
jgi:predicted TIM-barrel fold metal-dependent hydrolase